MTSLFIAALAVYKLMQLLDALTPREAMPWVKVIAGVVLSYLSVLVIDVPNVALSGLAIATMAGTIHAVLRLIMLTGDAARKKSIR